MKLAEPSAKPVHVPTISTGSLGLDLALGIGGLARGRITEIYGPESCGKTTLALQVVAEAHKLGNKSKKIFLRGKKNNPNNFTREKKIS
jgi:recombination protein RecA